MAEHAPRTEASWLHPSWLRAMDASMDVELAMEIAEMMSIGHERDLVLAYHLGKDDLTSALDIVREAGQIATSISPTHAENLISTFACLSWMSGDDQAAEQFATHALRLNAKNVLAIIVLTAVNNPEKNAAVKNKFLANYRSRLPELLDQARTKRGLLAQLLNDAHRNL